MLVFNIILLVLNIFQTTSKCKCYEGKDSTGDIYIMHLQDTSYVLKILSNFHGQFTQFDYAGTYTETDSIILIIRSSHKKGAIPIKKSRNAIYLEHDLIAGTYIKMKKKNCAKLITNKIPKERISKNPFPD